MPRSPSFEDNFGRRPVQQKFPLDLVHIRGLRLCGKLELGGQVRFGDRNARASDMEESLQSFFGGRSEEHTSELQSLMRISYAVFCLKKKKPHRTDNIIN